ncbi:hypothetical protein ONZ45_g11881 [Pleurotus djamor]|nr:hypothetical protein ONZ45_g11881 [Pleurotus djamor]
MPRPSYSTLFFESVGPVGRWQDIVETGWAEIRNLLPFFTNLGHLSVCSALAFPSEIILSLPKPGQLTQLRILTTRTDGDLVPVLKQHPNLQLLRVSYRKYTRVPEQIHDALVDLPALVSLEPSPTLWSFLSRQLSTASFSVLKHFSITSLTAPLPPIPTMNNLQSLRMTCEDAFLVRQVLQHLHNIEYLYVSLSASRSDVCLPHLLMQLIFIQNNHVYLAH